MKKFLLMTVLIQLGASLSYAAGGILCTGIDHSQKPIQVQVRDIRKGSVVPQYTEATLRVVTEKRSTTICKTGEFSGIKGKVYQNSIDGDLIVECDGKRSGAPFKGDYFLGLNKVADGQYKGRFCGGEVKTVGGVDIDYDCVENLTCSVVSQ